MARRFRRNNYKFTERSHSLMGIFAVILSVSAIIALFTAVKISYDMGGEAGVFIGAVGALALMASILSVILGVMGWKNEDTYDFFSKVGFFIGVIAVILWVVTIIFGLY